MTAITPVLTAITPVREIDTVVISKSSKKNHLFRKILRVPAPSSSELAKQPATDFRTRTVRSASDASDRQKQLKRLSLTDKLQDTKISTFEDYANLRFTTLTEAIVKKLSPDIRSTWKYKLQRLLNQDDDSSDDKSPLKSSPSRLSISDDTLPVKNLPDESENRLSPHDLKRTLDIFEKVQKELREQWLLEFLRNEKNWDLLFLSGQTIIPAEVLFSLINQELSNQSNHESPRYTVVLFQKFCKNWLQQNEGTLWVREAKTAIETIIKTTARYNIPQVQEMSKQLSVLLTKALIPRGEIELITVISNPQIKSSNDFRSILQHVAAGTSVSNYEKFIDGSAFDLFLHQGSLYTQIKPDDLIVDKWDDQSRIIHKYREHCQALTNSIARTISTEHNENKKIRIVHFFLEIAHSSLKKYNDFASAYTLFKATSQFLHECASCSDKKSDLAIDFFNPLNFDYLQKIMKERFSQRQAYIPYLEVYLTNISHLKALSPTEIVAERYNIKDLELVRECIFQALAGQELLKASLEYYKSAVPFSNFISSHLKQ